MCFTINKLVTQFGGIMQTEEEWQRCQFCGNTKIEYINEDGHCNKCDDRVYKIRERLIKKLLTDQKIDGADRFIALGFCNGSKGWLTDEKGKGFNYLETELKMMMQSNLTDIVIMIHKKVK